MAVKCRKPFNSYAIPKILLIAVAMRQFILITCTDCINCRNQYLSDYRSYSFFFSSVAFMNWTRVSTDNNDLLLSSMILQFIVGRPTMKYYGSFPIMHAGKERERETQLISTTLVCSAVIPVRLNVMSLFFSSNLPLVAST